MKGLWWALQRRWNRDDDWHAGRPMTMDVTAHPDKDTAIEMWESGGKNPTIGIRIGASGHPHISLLMSAAKYGGSDGCDSTLDMLCRFQRAIEDATEVVRSAHRGH